MYRVQSTEYTTEYTEYRVQSTQCTEYRVQSTEYRVHRIQSTEYSVSVHYCSPVLILHCISLDWDKYRWTGIGDEGVTALADPRVIKNFKTLK